MNKYEVHIYENVSYSVPVEAENEDEANEKAMKLFHKDTDKYLVSSDLTDGEVKKLPRL